jgi:type II secretory pathway pseudopilin PulG
MKSPGHHRSNARGSTLVELIVVAGIIILLISLLVPMFAQAHDRASRAKCMDNLRKIGRALRDYADENRGRLPSTRPATLSDAPFDMLPDVSNSGYDCPNPFAADGPRFNNIPAALFLLLRTQELSPKVFICPATEAVPDDFGGMSPLLRSNFSDVGRNLTYAIQNPYASGEAIASGFRWQRDLPEAYPLVADRGPAVSGSPAPRNSPNHAGLGQNLLFADGSVGFRRTPLAGIDNDHIYLSRSFRLLDSPSDRADSILLPAVHP